MSWLGSSVAPNENIEAFVCGDETKAIKNQFLPEL